MIEVSKLIDPQMLIEIEADAYAEDGTGFILGDVGRLLSRERIAAG